MGTIQPHRREAAGLSKLTEVCFGQEHLIRRRNERWEDYLIMRRTVLSLTLLILFTDVSTAASNVSTCWLTEGSCRAFIGKRLWVLIPPGNPNIVEITFTQHDWTTEKTLKLKSGSSFVVKDIVKANVGSDDYLVLLDDGRRGWAGTSSPFLVDYDPVARSKHAAEECARRGQPKIGMSSSELVQTCWGKPVRIVKKVSASGIEESFLYGTGHKVKVIDGKVAEIVETR